MRFTTIFLCTLLTAHSIAATYYVDHATGNNTADGTSKQTAWKHAPGDAQATGIPAGTKLAADDTVIFKGGITYFGGMTVTASGLTGQPITYDGNTAGKWGAGRAIIDRGHVVQSAFNLPARTKHIAIKGFEIRNVGGYADDDPILQTIEPRITQPKGGTAINMTAGGNADITLRNLLIHRVGQWRNQKPFSGAQSVTGQGIAMENCDGIKIENCEFTKMRIPISIKATTAIRNITVQGCDLHDYIVWGIDIAPRRNGAVLENITIKDTKIRDYHQFDSGNWLGWGEKPHTDGIFLRASGMKSTWKNILIQGCQFYSTNSGKSKGGTASIYVSEGPSVDIMENSFIQDPHSRTVGIGHTNVTGQTQIVRIRGNTFAGGPAGVLLAGESDPKKREVYIESNTFFRDGLKNSTMINHQGGVLPKVLDGNTYMSSAFTEAQKKVAVITGKGYLTLSQLKALGYEANGKFEQAKPPVLLNLSK